VSADPGRGAATTLAPPPQRPRRGRGRQVIKWLLGIAAIIAVVVLLWNEGQRLLDGEASGAQCYVIAAALVFGDAIIPVLPGETTLNAACLLAANGQLDLILVMISGAVGAIAGDSTLYWIARSAHGKTKASAAPSGRSGSACPPTSSPRRSPATRSPRSSSRPASEPS